MKPNIHTEEHQIEEMRQQIALLKAKLEKETIVTDKMIRSTIKQKMEKKLKFKAKEKHMNVILHILQKIRFHLTIYMTS